VVDGVDAEVAEWIVGESIALETTRKVRRRSMSARSVSSSSVVKTQVNWSRPTSKLQC